MSNWGGLFSLFLYQLLTVTSAIRGLDFVFYLIYSICILITYILVVAVFTLFERKLLAGVQRRRGPNVVGAWGFLQPVADGLKLVVKEFIKPRRVKFIFWFAPLLVLVVAFLVWSIVPTDALSATLLNLSVDILYFLAVSSLTVYGIATAGWSSGSRYATLAAARAVAQLISYEVAFGLAIMPPLMFSQSMSFTGLIELQANVLPFAVICPVSFVCCIIVMLAESNRTPFDLPEAEAELVAGFNVEYSSTSFALFFLAEYGSMFAMSIFISIMFLGGWCYGKLWFVASVLGLNFFYVLVRGAVPRYRYDQLMLAFWKYSLLLVLSTVIFLATFFILSGARQATNSYVGVVIAGPTNSVFETTVKEMLITRFPLFGEHVSNFTNQSAGIGAVRQKKKQHPVGCRYFAQAFQKLDVVVERFQRNTNHLKSLAEKISIKARRNLDEAKPANTSFAQTTAGEAKLVAVHPLKQQKTLRYNWFACCIKYLQAVSPKYLQQISITSSELDIASYQAVCGRLLAVLKHHTTLRFRTLLDIVIYDRPELPKRFVVVYVLLSPQYNARAVLRTQTNEIFPLMSVIRLFQNSNWLEREAWDMFGVFFFWHVDLRRILTDYGFRGHPLRKDFPLSGYIELWFSPYSARILYLPVSFSQEFRALSRLSPWSWYFSYTAKSDRFSSDRV